MWGATVPFRERNVVAYTYIVCTYLSFMQNKVMDELNFERKWLLDVCVLSAMSS